MSITHPNNLRTSQAGLDLIKQIEGLRLHWYICPAGKPTIGYGHVLRSPKEQKELVQITEVQADELLVNDCRTCEIYINANIRVTLTQNQFDALVSFSLNLGVGALEPAKSTLRRMLDEANYKGAADQFKRWNKITNPENGAKIVNEGLTKRRLKERDLFLKAD